MVADRYQRDVFFAPGARVVPLGHIDADGDLTLGDTVGGTLRGFRLTDEYRNLLADHDRLLSGQGLSAHERALLWWMGNQGMVAIIPAGSAAEALELIPVLRRKLTRVEDAGADGYRIHVDGGESLFASELAARFLPHMDGKRTLGELADVVRRELLENEEDAQAIREAESAEGRDLTDFLAVAALELVIGLLSASAATFERTS